MLAVTLVAQVQLALSFSKRSIACLHNTTNSQSPPVPQVCLQLAQTKRPRCVAVSDLSGKQNLSCGVVVRSQNEQSILHGVCQVHTYLQQIVDLFVTPN